MSEGGSSRCSPGGGSGPLSNEERLERRDTFLGDADDYAAVRPGYPDELLREACGLGGLSAGDSILEVGCGPGTATRWFAEAGFEMVALDRGDSMVAHARQALAGYGNVRVELADFESWDEPGVFDGFLCATSWHWLPLETRIDQAADRLRPDGALLLLWHTHPRPFEGFFERVQPIYESVAPNWEPPPSPGMIEERIELVARRLRDSGRFPTVERRGHDWSKRYSKDDYLRLMATYSDHRLLDDEPRRELFERVADLIDQEFDGAVDRPYRSELIVARRHA